MRRLLVISGAGMSTESGIRTFRTDTSSGKALWDEYDLEEVCNIHAFRSNFYHKTHEFYNKRREELKTVHPNMAHLRVAGWYNRYPGQVRNLTTNVDDLLERAGIPKKDILHVHGFLKEIVVQNGEEFPKRVIDVGYAVVNPDDYWWCKPNVVFFGENAPLYQDMFTMLDDLNTQDLVLLVGCSNQVIDFNWELLHAIAKRGIKLVVINPAINYFEQEQYDKYGVYQMRCGAVEAFSNQKLIDLVENHLEGNPVVTSEVFNA